MWSLRSSPIRSPSANSPPRIFPLPSPSTLRASTVGPVPCSAAALSMEVFLSNFFPISLGPLGPPPQKWKAGSLPTPSPRVPSSFNPKSTPWLASMLREKISGAAMARSHFGREADSSYPPYKPLRIESLKTGTGSNKARLARLSKSFATTVSPRGKFEPFTNHQEVASPSTFVAPKASAISTSTFAKLERSTQKSA